MKTNIGWISSGEISDYPRIHWVIVGGESGPGRRDCGAAAIEDVAQQCVRAYLPVFVKQASAPKPGQRGQLSDAIWALKQFPTVA